MSLPFSHCDTALSTIHSYLGKLVILAKSQLLLVGCHPRLIHCDTHWAYVYLRGTRRSMLDLIRNPTALQWVQIETLTSRLLTRKSWWK